MKIQFLENSFGNDAGDIVRIVQEDDACVYYYDSFRRWCVLFKEEEGKLFRYVEEQTVPIPIRIRTPEERAQYWQEKSGEFADIAEWALKKVLYCISATNEDKELAEEHLKNAKTYAVLKRTDI